MQRSGVRPSVCLSRHSAAARRYTAGLLLCAVLVLLGFGFFQDRAKRLATERPRNDLFRFELDVKSCCIPCELLCFGLAPAE